MKKTSFIESVAEQLLIIVGLVLVLAPLSPWNMALAYRDSGVFLYTGWRILNGELPYVDVWDHKPPVIYYINALGLGLAGGSRWGVWSIEFAFLLIAAYLSLKLLKAAFGFLPALFGTYLWLLSLVFVIEGGNLTTEYTLPLQFGCFWLAYASRTTTSSFWHNLLIGALCGFAFLTKQNTIGTGLAVLALFAIRRVASKQYRQFLVEDLLPVAMGGAIVVAIVVLYFYGHGALFSFWTAAFAFNFEYASAGIAADRLVAMGLGLKYLMPTSLSLFALAGWLLGGLWLIRYKTTHSAPGQLVSIAVIALPIELVMSSASVRGHAHYAMALLPVCAILSGFCFWLAIPSVLPGPNINRQSVAVTLAMLVIITGANVARYINVVTHYQWSKDEMVIRYITDFTSNSDYVLMLGSETTTNFYSQRLSPTRYVYQHQLFSSRYQNQEMIEEFVHEVIQKKPRLIIDTLGRDFWQDQMKKAHASEIKSLLRFIETNYELEDHFGSWVVYSYTVSPQADS